MTLPPSPPARRRPAIVTFVVLTLAIVPAASAQEPRRERPRTLPAEPRSSTVFAALTPALVIVRPTDNPLHRFNRFVDTGVLPTGLSPAVLRAGGYRGLQPLASRALGPDASVNLALGFSLALDRVARRESCAELFAALGTDGLLALTTTSYMPPTAEQESRLCRRGAMAFTVVGTPVTWLCGTFGRLPRQTAALALIHEALHYAGLPEQPVEAAAPTPAQINRLVAKRCGL